jgi:hypothetical protein
MFRVFSFSFWLLCFLELSVAQKTSCPQCTSLESLWNPTTNTGSCLTNASDPVSYIVQFEQCICSPNSSSVYAQCAACNGNIGIPIDGLNFGPPSSFSSACSRFSEDVTSILQPSGLNAFASFVRAAMSTPNSASADILGYYAFQNIITQAATQMSIVTDSVIFSPTHYTVSTNVNANASASRTAMATVGSGSVSDAGGRASVMPITAIFITCIIAISSAIAII